VTIRLLTPAHVLPAMFTLRDTRRLLKTLARRFPRRRLFVLVRGHALALINGKVHDIQKESPRTLVLKALEITPAKLPRQPPTEAMPHN
jgi:hypothetical protein